MRYIKVEWVHSFPDEAIWIYSESGPDGWETRKVEVFRDGTMGFADREREFRSGLSETQIGSLEEIASDPYSDCRPAETTKEEFEEVWERALKQADGQPEG